MKWTLLALILAPLPAAAGDWTAPEGCTTFMTVQARGCRVSNHYRCTADAAGDQWRADFDQEGISFMSRINSEGEWIESLELFPTVRQQLDPGAADPASFSDLLRDGVDRYRFGLSDDTGERSAVVGRDKLTGKTVVIDGIPLSQTEFEFSETAADGTVLRQSRGNEFIHAEWRLFFSGPSEWWDGAAWLPLDGSPMAFVFPGEPGFATTQPLFDCDELMSEMPLEGPIHDNL